MGAPQCYPPTWGTAKNLGRTGSLLVTKASPRLPEPLGCLSPGLRSWGLTACHQSSPCPCCGCISAALGQATASPSAAAPCGGKRRAGYSTNAGGAASARRWWGLLSFSVNTDGRRSEVGKAGWRVWMLCCPRWLCRPETGTGCPGRLWTLLLWRYSKPAWTRSCAACCRWPCFGRGVGPDDPQRSLPTPTTLWFCDWRWWRTGQSPGRVNVRLNRREHCCNVVLIYSSFQMPGYSGASSDMRVADSVTWPQEGVPQPSSCWHRSIEFAVSSNTHTRRDTPLAHGQLQFLSPQQKPRHCLGSDLSPSTFLQCSFSCDREERVLHSQLG